MCSSKDLITGVFWYDTAMDLVQTSQCESASKICFFLYCFLLSVIQLHAHAPRPLCCREGGPPWTWAQTNIKEY